MFISETEFHELVWFHLNLTLFKIGLELESLCLSFLSRQECTLTTRLSPPRLCLPTLLFMGNVFDPLLFFIQVSEISAWLRTLNSISDV